MRALFLCPPNASAEEVRRELDRLFGSIGDTFVVVPLGRHEIAVTETKIGHGLGMVPTGWREHSPEGFGRVCQVRPPDRTFLYLQADNVVTVHLEVF